MFVRGDQRGSDQAMSSDDLVKFAIPAEFVTARVLLTPGELVYGYRHGWLGDRAVVEVALAAYAAGGDLPSAEEELALLLSDSLGRVPELLEDLARPEGRRRPGRAVPAAGSGRQPSGQSCAQAAGGGEPALCPSTSQAVRVSNDTLTVVDMSVRCGMRPAGSQIVRPSAG